MNTAHRAASRAKRKTYPLIPKWWQPKVAPELQSTCQVIHWDNITAFTHGTADEALAGTGIVPKKPQKAPRDTFSCHGCGRFLSQAAFWGGECPHCCADNRP